MYHLIKTENPYPDLFINSLAKLFFNAHKKQAAELEVPA